MSISMVEEWNADLLKDFKTACLGLLDLWPDIMTADPLLVSEGGVEAGYALQASKASVFNEGLVDRAPGKRLSG